MSRRLYLYLPVLLLVAESPTLAHDWNALVNEPGTGVHRCTNLEYTCAPCKCGRQCQSRSVNKKNTGRASGAQDNPPRRSPKACSPFVSYAAVDQDAKSRGGYRPGRRVVISIGQADATNRAWLRDCNLNGWTFCVHDHAQPGLAAGVSQHVADSRGQLHPLIAAESVTQVTDSATRYAVAPFQSTPGCFVAEPLLFTGGDCAAGACRQGASR